MLDTKTIILDIGYIESPLRLTENNCNESYPKNFKFNIKVVKFVKKILELNGVNVVLAQPLNLDEIPLKDKIALENLIKPDGFISIQTNKNLNNKFDDWIFYWHTSHESGKLAAFIDRALDDYLNNIDRDITASMPGSWNDFQILKDMNCPTVIIEYNHISKNKKYSTIKYALSIAEGIMEFLGMKDYTLKIKKSKLVILIEGIMKLLDKLLNRIKEKEEYDD